MKNIIYAVVVALSLFSCSKQKQEKYGDIFAKAVISRDAIDICPMNPEKDTNTKAFLYKCDGSKVYGNVFEWDNGLLHYGQDKIKIPDYQNDCVNGIVSFSNIEYGNYLLVISTDAYIYPVIEKVKINVNSDLIEKNIRFQIPADLLTEEMREVYKDLIISEQL